MHDKRRLYGVRKSLAIGLAAASLAAPSALGATSEFAAMNGSKSGPAHNTILAYEAAAEAHHAIYPVPSKTVEVYAAAFEAYKDSKKTEAMRSYNTAIQSHENNRNTEAALPAFLSRTADGPDALATKIRALTAASEQLPVNPVSPQNPAVVATSDDISFRDASIGAAIAAVIVLAGVAVALFLRSGQPMAPGH